MLKFRKLALAAAALLIGTSATTAFAQYQKGPNPTNSALERTGPFATSRDSVSSLVAGFGGGDLYYPVQSGSYGAIVLCPGFTAGASSLAWLGPRLASHGFVVLIIDTSTRLDQPGSRARQLREAAEWLTTSSSVRSRIDRNRVAVGGHSMGGGGTLEAVRDNPSFKAGVPLAPWNTTKSFRTIRVPTMIFGGSTDTIASTGLHSVPFYTSISAAPKFYIELRGAGHFFPQTSDPTVSRYAISWYKRWVDEDTRYSSILNGSAPSSLTVSDFRRSGSF
jgi:dienelactone hydrolase